VYIGKLRQALVDAQARLQELRSTALFYGNRIPGSLTREVGRSEKLWKQILEIQSLPDLVNDKNELGKIGVIFLDPLRIEDKGVQSLDQLKKITSASRISIVCLSNQSHEIGKLRNRCDYYISEETDWRSFLDRLAETRLMRQDSSLNIDEAKHYLKTGKLKSAQKVLQNTVKLSPLKVEAILLSGECDFLRKDFKRARLKYQAALALNPCLPKPYARLLQIETGGDRDVVLNNALAYCPGVIEFRDNIGKA
jgi:hypothetical protein